jgi:hypothetical protein
MKKPIKISPLFLIIPFIFVFPSITYAKDSSIVIFDGSGSMKKKIDGKAKFEIASEVMSNLVQNWNEDIDLGLMVYGHRSKACDDIEMVIPVGTPDADKFLAAIKAIKPKGETPIAESMRQAAEKLNYEESPTTIILISDGEESCHADPCAMAKQLEASGTNFTAHVIGFDVSGEKQAKALEQLKCVAESTGGQFIEAKDSDGLKAALEETAKVVAAPEPVPAPKTEPVKISQKAGIIWEDHFDRETLGDAFEIIEPDEDRMVVSDGGLLLITTSPAKNIVSLKQKVSGDFEASVKISVAMTKRNQAGIKYSSGAGNHIALGFAVGGAGNAYIYFNKMVKGKENKSSYNKEIGKRKLHSYEKREQEDWYLKIKKKGFKFSAYASVDGKQWVNVGEHALLKKEGNISLEVFGDGVEDPVIFDDFMIKPID